MIMAQHEFLPLCDVLFNIISLAAYFCDVVFDVVMGYALFVHKEFEWFAVIIGFVLFSSIIEQTMSLKWYIHLSKGKGITENKNDDTVIRKYNVGFVAFLHLIQFGILWRYFKLFIPVDLRFVKYEVRDLCMLRLVHAFCESMPLLLIQLYLFWENCEEELSDLITISMLLSLFSVCWALASFSKNVRMHNVHRLVLTWLGVIFQFFWRLGTVAARAISLVAYASLFKSWIFLVILLHWISMLLWLLSPKNLFHGERLSCGRKALLYSVIAFVYTFAYINLLEANHREKMLMFYVIMGLENAMLMFVWVVGVSTNKPAWYCALLPMGVLVLFSSGIAFMAFYYRYFHVRRLKYEAGGRLNNNQRSNICDIGNNNNNNISNGLNGCLTVSVDRKDIDHMNDKDVIRRHSFSGGYTNLNDLAMYSRMHNENSLSGEEGGLSQNPQTNEVNNHLGGIPGVFNCRFSNPYMAAIQKRKRKKPTSFIPPPSITHDNETDSNKVEKNHIESTVPTYGYTTNTGYNSVPFWCRPLPNNYYQQGCGSENEGSSVGSRPDIQQKLQEKKQKQLAELRIIEEEMKQGKLHQRPNGTPSPDPSPPPPPQDKKSPRYNTTEILLAPHYLDAHKDENQYYDWPVPEISSRTSIYRLLEEEPNDQMLTLMYKSYRSPSDLDSQLSLPRSYTLPREFKYYRKTRPRKPVRFDHFVTSTNSSDGDVDSGDDSGSTSSHTISQHPPTLPPHSLFRVKHETKL